MLVHEWTELNNAPFTSSEIYIRIFDLVVGNVSSFLDISRPPHVSYPHYTDKQDLQHAHYTLMIFLSNIFDCSFDLAFQLVIKVKNYNTKRFYSSQVNIFLIKEKLKLNLKE